MADLDPKALYHRTLDGWAELARLPYIDYVARKDAFDRAAQKTGTTLGTAYKIRDRKLLPILYVEKKDQDFRSYATKWEYVHSRLPFRAWGMSSGEPLVDENLTVIGHINWFDRDSIFVPAKDAAVTRRGWKKYTPPPRPLLNRLFSDDDTDRTTKWYQVEETRDLGALLADGVEVYADKSQESYLSRGYVRPLPPQTGYRLVTDIEGRALFVAETHDRESVEPSWVSPLDLISIVKLVALLGTAAIGMVAVRMLARQAAARTLRGVITREAANEAAAAASRDAAADAAGGASNAAGAGARNTLRGVGAQGGREGAGAGTGAARTGNTLRGMGAQGGRESGSSAAGGAARGAVRETASGAFQRRVGRMSVDEMEAYLRQVLANRPDLRRLMSARVLTGQGRMDAIKLALQEFERGQGWKVVEKTAAEMEAVTTRGNIVTMRAEVRELWINSERAARFDPTEYYNHVVHDLSAHALAGRGGTLTGTELPFLGVSFTRHTNGLFILEEAIKRGDVEGVLATFR